MKKLSEHFKRLNTKPAKVAVPHAKHTLNQVTIQMHVPDQVKIRLSQHIGAPCKPVVSLGDLVKVGQIIATSEAVVFAPIHASVSGEVVNIADTVDANGLKTCEITLKSDGKQLLHEGITPPNISSKEDFIEAVRASGLVGLGGAGFPTHVKLNVSPEVREKIDMLLINAAECEPYITSDVREILENPYDILDGIQAVSKHLEIKQVMIAIEDTNQQAIQLLSDILSNKRETYPHVSVKILPSTYPQGAEKVLVQSCTNRVIPLGKLPADVGVVVMNVSSIGFLGRYLKTGIPLTSRRVTVDGDAIKKPGNVWAPIGTMTKDLIAFCGGYQKEAHLLIHGGPMMGLAQTNDETPIKKTTNAVLAFGELEMREHKEIACIRCARCIDVCPVNLMPVTIDQNVRLKKIDALQTLSLNACLDCGLCSFACPSNRMLVQNIRVGKGMLHHLTKGDQA